MAGRTDANIRGNTTAFLNILAIGALAPTSASKCLSPNGGMVGLRPSCTNGCDLPHEVLYWSTDFRWCSFWQLTPLFKATYAMLRPYPDKKIRKALYG
jgi:hypothetical protein